MTCFISDPIGVKNRHEIGIDNICWEMDYPHSDSMWPGAPEELAAVFDTYDVPDDEINKITHENAMRLYHFEPFTHIPKDQATVGALRKAADGHDVSIRALSPRTHRREDQLPGLGRQPGQGDRRSAVTGGAAFS